jgi:hypothetical protein
MRWKPGWYGSQSFIINQSISSSRFTMCARSS